MPQPPGAPSSAAVPFATLAVVPPSPYGYAWDPVFLQQLHVSNQQYPPTQSQTPLAHVPMQAAYPTQHQYFPQYAQYPPPLPPYPYPAYSYPFVQPHASATPLDPKDQMQQYPIIPQDGSLATTAAATAMTTAALPAVLVPDLVQMNVQVLPSTQPQPLLAFAESPKQPDVAKSAPPHGAPPVPVADPAVPAPLAVVIPLGTRTTDPPVLPMPSHDAFQPKAHVFAPNHHLNAAGAAAISRLFASTDEVRREQAGTTYTLQTIQHPARARMIGFGEKDRRPIDPPPIIQLVTRNRAGDLVLPFADAPHFVMHVSLWSDDATTECSMVLNPFRAERSGPPCVHAIVGLLVSQCHILADEAGDRGMYFIFPDVSIRVSGRFRLKYMLFSVKDLFTWADSAAKAVLFSEPFTVYTPKEFPGVALSTPVSKLFSKQGVRIYIRPEGPIGRARVNAANAAAAAAAAVLASGSDPPADTAVSASKRGRTRGIPVSPTA